jgi:5-formyltetrahydrofolate cyclo-ligase
MTDAVDDGPDAGPGAPDERKAALRASARVARRALSAAQRRTASATIVARLAALRDLAAAGTVAVFAATDEEPDLTDLVALLRARAVRPLLPRVVGDDLEVAEFVDGPDGSAPGFRGLLEPTGARVDEREVEAVLVPGVAFDPTGARLGRGGGHYDRLLARLPDACVRIGVCFACQVVPSVPRLEHDRGVDAIITERSVHRPVRTRDLPPRGT